MLLFRVFSILGFFGVALGAFGAHALKNKVTSDDVEIWKTATLYLFVHVLAGLFAVSKENKGAAIAFLTGTLIFSGSLYALVLTQVRVLGAITPVGGVSFMVGWLFLVLKK